MVQIDQQQLKELISTLQTLYHYPQEFGETNTSCVLEHWKADMMELNNSFQCLEAFMLYWLSWDGEKMRNSDIQLA